MNWQWVVGALPKRGIGVSKGSDPTDGSHSAELRKSKTCAQLLRIEWACGCIYGSCRCMHPKVEWQQAGSNVLVIGPRKVYLQVHVHQSLRLYQTVLIGGIVWLTWDLDSMWHCPSCRQCSSNERRAHTTGNVCLYWQRVCRREGCTHSTWRNISTASVSWAKSQRG